jgi:hypothetical protein
MNKNNLMILSIGIKKEPQVESHGQNSKLNLGISGGQITHLKHFPKGCELTSLSSYSRITFMVNSRYSLTLAYDIIHLIWWLKSTSTSEFLLLNKHNPSLHVG